MIDLNTTIKVITLSVNVPNQQFQNCVQNNTEHQTVLAVIVSFIIITSGVKKSQSQEDPS